MPQFRYVFYDGANSPVTEARELDNIKAAKDEAVVAAGELLKDMDGAFWRDSHWRLEVTDDVGLLICAIDIDGAQSPASGEYNLS